MGRAGQLAGHFARRPDGAQDLDGMVKVGRELPHQQLVERTMDVDLEKSAEGAVVVVWALEDVGEAVGQTQAIDAHQRAAVMDAEFLRQIVGGVHLFARQEPIFDPNVAQAEVVDEGGDPLEAVDRGQQPAASDKAAHSAFGPHQSVADQQGEGVADGVPVEVVLAGQVLFAGKAGSDQVGALGDERFEAAGELQIERDRAGLVERGCGEHVYLSIYIYKFAQAVKSAGPDNRPGATMTSFRFPTSKEEGCVRRRPYLSSPLCFWRLWLVALSAACPVRAVPGRRPLCGRTCPRSPGPTRSISRCRWSCAWPSRRPPRPSLATPQPPA